MPLPTQVKTLLADIAQAREAIDKLLDGNRMKFKLPDGPVRPGSFAIPAAGIRDFADGSLYAEDGSKCGSIDYAEPSVTVDIRALRATVDWRAGFAVNLKAAKIA
jgi:hypothetical protein